MKIVTFSKITQNRVHIPKEIRKLLGITNSDDELAWVLNDNHEIVLKKRDKDNKINIITY